MRTGHEAIAAAVQARAPVPHGLEESYENTYPGLPRRYVVEATLGGGGVTSVHRVHDRAKRNAIVVLKTTSPGGGEEQTARLKSEYRILSQLSHPGITCVHDFGYASAGGGAYFTQDWVEGKNILDTCRGAELCQVLSWVGQTCVALNYLHGQGVVHGDIKPQHILVTPAAEDTERTVRIIDFGFARGPDSEPPLLLGGTLPYMAPEVADGLPADHRADIYSLGVVLFDALTLALLGEEVEFERERAAGRLQVLVDAGLPTAVHGLVTQMIARSPSERCADVREVYNSLAPLLETSGSRSLSSVLCVSAAGHPGLVNREALIESLQEMIDSLAAGQVGCRCAIISGEAGLGKSRVVDELKARAQLAGLVCVKATFGRADGSTYKPFEEAISTLQLGNSLGEMTPASAREERPGDGHRAVEDEAGTSRQWQAFVSSLVEASAGRPSVLILEDLHLADPEELGLWGCLVRRLCGAPLLVCVTYREEGGGTSGVSAIAEDLVHEGLAESFTLDHLEENDVRQFAERYLGAPGLDAGSAVVLREKSGGNPLYLRQIIAGLLEEPMGREFDGLELQSLVGRASVPPSLRDTIRDRFSRLNDDERECLSAIAVLLRPTSVRELCRVCKANPEVAQSAFRGLFTKGILRASGVSPGRFELEHSEAKEVAYEDTQSDARRELHRRAGEALEAEFLAGNTEVAEELADHFLEAGIEDKAGTYGLEAARRAARGFAFERACHYFEMALARIGQGSEAYLDAAEEYAEVCTRLNRHQQAAEWYRRLLQYPMQELYRGRILTKLGSALHALRERDRAAAALEEAGQLLGPFPDSPEAVRLRITLLGMLIDRGECEEALKGLLKLDKGWLAEAPLLRGHLYDDIARAYYHLSKLRLAQTWYRRAMTEYGRAGHGLKTSYMRRCLGHVAYASGEYRDAESLYQEALRELEPYGTNQEIGLTLTSLGNVAHVRGDLVASEERHREAARVLRKYGRPAQVADVLISLAFTQLHLGLFRLARLTVREGISLCGSAADMRLSRLNETVAIVALTTGDLRMVDEALAQMRACRTGASLTPASEMRLFHLEGWRASLSGSQDEAARLLRGYLRAAKNLDQNAEVCEASVSLARVLGPGCDEAFALAQGARQVAGEAGHLIWNLEALNLIGECHVLRGEFSRAIPALAKCVEGCRRTGMKDLHWRAMSLLASAHQELGNSRYAIRYDEECVDLLMELRGQFDSNESWAGYLSMWGRGELYGGVAGRIRARAELAVDRRDTHPARRRSPDESVAEGTEKR